MCVTLPHVSPPACNLRHVPLFLIKVLTMRSKDIQLYASDSVIEEFYKALADRNARKLRRIHIPKSDVFYVRAAIEADTGVRYSLDHVERAMYLEGMLDRKDVLDPDRERPGID
jgi:hypothetical protein